MKKFKQLFGRIKNLFGKIIYFEFLQKANIFLSRGVISAALRDVNYTDPKTWEFSGLSQNGEDGIIDVLSRKIKNPNRYFVEIGCGNGIENNTAFLALVKRWTGIMVEGDKKQISRMKRFWGPFAIVDCLNLFVSKDNISEIEKLATFKNPDVFSLDIDGNDYYVAMAFLEKFRPKIIAVEYNSSFGPDLSVAIDYRENIYEERERRELPVMYWGCSLEGWKKAFKERGYKFVTCDSNGINAFFIDEKEFDEDFVKNLGEGFGYAMNISTRWSHGIDWRPQYREMEHLPLLEV